MKRGTRPFIVEVRRGQKRAHPIEGEEDSSISRNEAVRRAEAALFGVPAPPHLTAKLEPSPVPEPRRILASLTDIEVPAGDVAEPEPIVRRGRKPGKLQPRTESEPHGKRRLADKTAARRVPLTPELVNAALDEIEKATQAVPRWSATGASSLSERHSVAVDKSMKKATRGRRKKAAAPVVETKGKITHQPATAVPAVRPGSMAKVERAAPPSPPLDLADKPRVQRPRPSIRGRYVFGTEPKPGERWKRRQRQYR